MTPQARRASGRRQQGGHGCRGSGGDSAACAENKHGRALWPGDSTSGLDGSTDGITGGLGFNTSGVIGRVSIGNVPDGTAGVPVNHCGGPAGDTDFGTLEQPRGVPRALVACQGMSSARQVSQTRSTCGR